MRKYIGLLLAVIACIIGHVVNASAEAKENQVPVARIDTLWPVRTWNMSFLDKSFPCELYSGDGLDRECVVKGFTVDERERFYILGGDPTVSLACYEGERQVWRRELGIPLTHSLYALMKVRGDSLYFFDEQKFCMRRIHRDGHGKVACAKIDVLGNDSLAWGCVYADRFRVQVGRRQEMGNEGNFTARLLMLDVYFDGTVREVENREVNFWHEKRLRMYGGGKGGDALRGSDFDYYPIYVRSALRDTIREVRFYGAPCITAVTSMCEQIWGVVMPATILARVGNWLYMPGTLNVGFRFVIRKYDAHALWSWMRKAEVLDTYE